MSGRVGTLPIVGNLAATSLPVLSGRLQKPRTALDFLMERWRFCAGFSFAIMLFLAIRLIDALSGPAWSTLIRSVAEIWLALWLPSVLTVGVGIGLIDQQIRRTWQRQLGVLALVFLPPVVFLLFHQFVLAIVARKFGFVPLVDEIAADRSSFYWGQSSTGFLYLGLLAWFYLKVQDAERSGAALGATQLAGLRFTQAVAQDRLSSIQAHVDPDFLFAALSHVQGEYRRDAVKAQLALDEVIVFLRSALPRRHAEQRAFAEEIALAESYLRLAGLINGRQFELRTSFADAASEVAGFPAQLCLPLIKAMASIVAAEQAMHLKGRVVDSRFRVTMTMPVNNYDTAALAPLTAAVNAAKQVLAATCGPAATLQDYSANQHLHINIEVPYAPSANR